MQAIVKKALMIALITITACALGLGNAALADSKSNNEQVTHAVENFLYQQVQQRNTNESEIAIEVFAGSTYFGECENPQPFFPNANQEVAGRVSVGVRCGAQGNQVRYVQAQVSLISSFLVPKADIPSGTILTATMLTTAQGDLGRMRQAPVTETTALEGQVVRRNLRAGQPIYATMVQAAEIISRGDAVKIIAEGAGFQIEREGVAVDSGGLNETIRIRINTGDQRNRQLIDAKIIGPGRVTLAF
ncbi:flagellar basal body P-ring formation chaperone FlgA [Aliidiomarina iranensis]|nr:flagellar basal body P-ring formation chaperone FlgA [Aliidiomarina iranensis]